MVCGAYRVLMDWEWMSGTADQEPQIRGRRSGAADQERRWGGKIASIKCGIENICVDPDKSVGMRLP